MTDDVELPDEPADDEAAEEPGRVMGSYMGRITLRDPRSWDVSRANRPIEPAALTVQEIEAVINTALAEHGYAVTVTLTRTDKGGGA